MQRKLGTTRGSPRRSRTAKASRISRTVGEVATCLRVGRMGPISEEGPGQNNPDRSEGGPYRDRHSEGLRASAVPDPFKERSFVCVLGRSVASGYRIEGHAPVLHFVLSVGAEIGSF